MDKMFDIYLEKADQPESGTYRYGQALIEKCDGTLTAYGLIEREDHQPVLSVKNTPSQGGMEMKY